MKKTTLFIIIGLLIIGVAIPFTYILFEDYRPAIGDFFGGLRQSATVLFWGFSESFMQLPYWPAIAMGIAFLVGIIIDRWAWGIVLGMRQRLVGEALTATGLRPQQTQYQGGPGYSTQTQTQQQKPLPEQTTQLKEAE